jgi:hypothetical protein
MPSMGSVPRRHAWAAVALTVVLSLAGACESAIEIPADGQVVHVSSTPSELRLQPAIVHPGDAYLILDPPLGGVAFVHRTADFNDIHSPPLPLATEDMAALREQGSFQGGVIDAFSVHGSNVIRIGPLIEGTYALMIDTREGELGTPSPSLILVAELVVQP